MPAVPALRASSNAVFRSLVVAVLATCATAMLSPNPLGAQPPRGRRRAPGAPEEGRGGEEVTPPAAAKRGVPASWIEELRWRCIGPANMGGRITAIAVDPTDSSRWWVATASGGLLHTQNHGITFEHQFDHEATVSIGDVAVAPSQPDIVWVGTGEANPRNSVSWGNGVYKSTDGGKSWRHMGLDRGFQTGRIAIHPADPDTVYVGVLGRLWGANPERGLYKTTDGGETWKKILYVDEETGVSEVRMSPADPETLLVATYQRRRDGFDTNDPAVKYRYGSGLYRTTDGGASWTRITDGLPSCKLGRIGVDFCASQPDIAYAVVESERIGKEPANAAYLGVSGESADVGARVTQVAEKSPAEAAGLRVGDIIIAVEERTIIAYGDLLAAIRRFGAGDRVRVEVVRGGKSQLIDVALAAKPTPEEGQGEGRRRPGGFGRRGRRGALRNPFPGSLGGQRENLQGQQGDEEQEYGGVYRSNDGGATWRRVNTVNPRPMYFSQIRVDPSDPQRIYVLGVSLYRSSDGGETFTPDGGGRSVHVDHHALWIDPRDGRHMILGNDGGMYVTYDRMSHWDHLNHVAIGQFYDVAVGPRRDYRVYGGLQDNGSWGGPSRSRTDRGPTNEDWISIGGGDGFVCAVDPHDPELVYFESQNGGIGRRHLGTGERGFIRPRSSRRERNRFNWNTPFVLSHHNSKIYYVAGHRVFRSLDRGEGLRPISDVISRTERGSATALAESPRSADLLYVGTDDGALWSTEDGGRNWKNLLPWPVEKASESETGVEDGERREEAAASEGGEPEPPAVDSVEGGGEAVGDAGAGGESADAPGSEGDPGSEGGDEKETPDTLIGWLPGPRWVSHLDASRFEADRIYVTFDGHRSDDDEPYLYASDDRGQTWRSIRGDLPSSAGSVHVLREDLEVADLLYLGCEFGAWFSIDDGEHWKRFGGGLPTVAVHDFALHPRAGEIVAGTHGRSLWILDVTTLRQIAAHGAPDEAHLFRPAEAILWRSEPRRGAGIRRFVGDNPVSGTRIQYSLPEAAEEVSLAIETLDGKRVRTLEAGQGPGLHTVDWNLRRDPRRRRGAGRGFQRFRGFGRFGRRVEPGEYRVVLTHGDSRLEQRVKVTIDPAYPDAVWLTNEALEEEWLERHGSEDDGEESDSSVPEDGEII